MQIKIHCFNEDLFLSMYPKNVLDFANEEKFR
jgi:hypothetical protein